MRPLYLTMSAFGPFKDKIELDFSKLQDASLFLITGPTGSGKTTIFDAVSYALYGEPSGGMRDAKNFKSQFAQDTDLAYVVLEFALKGKHYKIKRLPKQVGPGERTKTKQINPTVQLEIDGVHQSGKKVEIDKQIVNILGLKQDQFKKIIMLPQGEFKELLTAPSNEKETIFRDIFQTHDLQAFQQTLKDQSSHYEDLIKAIRQKEDEVFKDLEEVDDPDLEGALAERNLNEVMNHINRINREKNHAYQSTLVFEETLEKEKNHYKFLADQLEKKDQLVQEKEALKEQEQTIEANRRSLTNAKQAQKLEQVDQQLSKIKKSIAETNKRIQKDEQRLKEVLRQEKRVHQELIQAREGLKDVPALEEQIDDLKAHHHQLNQLNELKESITTTHNHLVSTSQELKQLTEELNVLERQKSDSQKQIGNLEQSIGRLNEVKEKLFQAKEAKNQLLKEEKTLKEVQQTFEKGKKLSEAVKEQRQVVKDAQAQYDEKADHYYTNLAQSFSVDLKEGEPCPVCGSKTHPTLAHQSKGVAIPPTDKEELTASQDHLNQEKDALTKLTTQLEQQDNAYADLSQELGVKDQDLASFKKSLNKRCAENQKQIDSLEKEVKEIEEKENNLKQLNEKAKHLSDCYQKLLIQQSSIESKRKQLKENYLEETGRLKKLQDQLKDYADKEVDQVSEEVVALQQKIDRLHHSEKELTQQVQALEKESSSLHSSQKVLKNQAADYQVDLKNQNQEYQTLLSQTDFQEDYQDWLLDEAEEEDLRERIQTYEVNLKTNQQSLTNIEKQLAKEERLETIEDYRCLVKQIEEKLEKAEADKVVFITELDLAKRMEEKLKNIQKEKQDVSQKAQLYTTLSHLANGKEKVTNRTSFERFVLGVYFDQILQSANQRFASITDGRYRLVRSTSTEGAGGKGLDLDVMDYYTGKVRSVKTLSGGELFKASLSLALGLSDVVQSESGGVPIDTLFIDEGFGTLDQDSLDQAIEALIQLNQSGRLVGIISHVEELKTQIKTQIQVQASESGSKAHIVGYN